MMVKTFQASNDLKELGIVGRYAIGDSVDSHFYHEINFRGKKSQ
jgi:hypothetical protein